MNGWSVLSVGRLGMSGTHLARSIRVVHELPETLTSGHSCSTACTTHSCKGRKAGKYCAGSLSLSDLPKRQEDRVSSLHNELVAGQESYANTTDADSSENGTGTDQSSSMDNRAKCLCQKITVRLTRRLQ